MHPLIAAARESGPAADLYATLIPDEPISLRWLNEIRESWGQKDHPSLNLFPEIIRTQQRIPSLNTEVSVDVDILTPPTPSNAAIVYLHGGGWIAPIAGKHLGWAKRMAALCNQTVYVVHYRLAPEHPFPEGLKDCIAVLGEVFNRHPRNVSLAGDSAGANLAAAADQWQRIHQRRRPDRLLLICGVLDLQLEQHRSMQEFGVGHPYNGLELLAYQRALYAPSFHDWTNPLSSPAWGDLSSLPDTLVIVGEHDPLRDDGLDYAEKARSCGTNLRVLVGAGMPHGFVMQHDLVPEAALEAEAEILHFLGLDAP